MLRRRVLLLLAVAVGSAFAAACASAAIAVAATTSLPNRCVELRPGGRFYLKPTGFDTFLLLGQDGKLLSSGGRTSTPGPRSEWRVIPGSRPGEVTIRSTARGGGPLSLGGRTAFQLAAARGCRAFPEADVNATGTLFKGRRPGGTVFGFVDAHLHITAFMRAGGLVISGEPFDRFGIAAALGQDAKVHGSDGHLDYTGNLLRTANPVGKNDTHGWPTFTGWPTYNTQTHQQTYWVWLQRAWEAGERLVVAQTVDDAPLCRLEPRRLAVCDETSSIQNQVRELRAMQDYIDAQYGGPGRGWFRLVYSPAEARSVIAAGKLAVIIGIESSDLFGCTEVHGKPGCTRRSVDRVLSRYAGLGVRGMFVGHWVNNALTGTALEAGAKGIFINILNRLQTGAYFTTGKCPAAGQGATVLTLPASVLVSLTKFFRVAASVVGKGMPNYPPGLQCNPDGLTSLGRYVIDRMMARHMLIEVDHLSEGARNTVLSMAERAHYPLVSSHNGTGGTWTAAELRRLYRLGGFAAVTPAQAPTLASKINTMAGFRDPRRRLPGVGLGSDTGGFSSLPAPRSDAKANPLPYPFRSYDGKVTFARERTGTRTFDLNTDGVAHYGLMADLLADTGRAPGGRRALSLLFDSAEAYLEMWQRVVKH
ncbi:MAG: Coagulation factor 5/8 type domain-containing protein [Solirubrobacteraceae bacterium]